MKTAVIGEDADGLVIYNRALVDLARHYGFQPRACRSYRAKTEGKVERPFRYIREDFFLGGAFRNLDDLNDQLRRWLDTVSAMRAPVSSAPICPARGVAATLALQEAMTQAPYQCAAARRSRRARLLKRRRGWSTTVGEPRSSFQQRARQAGRRRRTALGLKSPVT